MKELDERNLENKAMEEAEQTAVHLAEDAAINENKNSTRTEAQAEVKAGAKRRKKRRRAKVALPAVAVLLLIALLFGVIAGYAVGRGVGAQRLRDAQTQIASLSAALEDAASAPAYSQFAEELTGENQSALDDLSGRGFEDEGMSELAGEDALLGQVLAGGESESVVVAEYDGGVIMSDEAAEEYQSQLASLVFSGYSEADISETLLDEVLKYMVSDRILEEKAKELGLFELTDADHATINAQTQSEYEEQLAFYSAFVNTEGMSQEEALGAVKSYLEQSEGVTLESMRAELEEIWWMNKLYDQMTEGVAVDASELQNAYDQLVEEQKADFTANAGDYEFAQASGETIAYNLPGYRAVRMLMFAFEDEGAVEAVSALTEEIADLDARKDAEEIAGYQAEIDAFYAPAEEKAAAALEQLRGGADFDALLDAGDDAGMNDMRLRETGYYVSENSTLWPQTMIDAAMALENMGDYSGVVRLEDGVCILQYVGEVASGAVALEDVKAALEESVLEEERFAVYSAQLDEWLEEAGAVYYPERMR